MLFTALSAQQFWQNYNSFLVLFNFFCSIVPNITLIPAQRSKTNRQEQAQIFQRLKDSERTVLQKMDVPLLGPFYWVFHAYDVPTYGPRRMRKGDWISHFQTKPDRSYSSISLNAHSLNYVKQKYDNIFRKISAPKSALLLLRLFRDV